ncbi:MAG: capsule-associated protein CAP1 [Cirrosporium novae-zelandiae]|nr:MAG: capsule-associated protein CAP1 [Cirrosporium novae-zelandiae]
MIANKLALGLGGPDRSPEISYDDSFATIKTRFTPSTHILLTSTISWSLVWIYSSLRKDAHDIGNTLEARKVGWAAGILLTAARLYERAAGVEDGLLWTRALLPIATLLFRWFSGSQRNPKTSHSSLARQIFSGHSPTLLTIFTISSLNPLLPHFLPSGLVTIGVCNALLVSQGYTLLEAHFDCPKEHDDIETKAGSTSWDYDHRSHKTEKATQDVVVLRSMAEVSTLAFFLCTLLFEGVGTHGLRFHREFEDMVGGDWKSGMRWMIAAQGILVGFIGGFWWPIAILMIRDQGALSLPFTDVGGTLVASFIRTISATHIWCLTLSAASSYCLFHDFSFSTFLTPRSKRMRSRQLITLCTLLSFAAITTILLRRPPQINVIPIKNSPIVDQRPLPEDAKPLPPTNLRSHPIYQLIRDAEQDFEKIKARQSKTLEEAVKEYRRRYKISPPPNFDKWYEYAKKRNVQLIDEYDTIYDSLLPFWALKPDTIRERARESLGFDNALIALLIRGGEVTTIQGGQEWQQKATVGMIQDFVRYLPDMDIPFNIHDEPRVIVPHEDLSRMVRIAKDEMLPAAFATENPRNAFSKRPDDMNDGTRVEEYKTTRFNYFAHQATWSNSKLSCSPDTPSRGLEENAPDNFTAYSYGELGFVYNKTSFSDICISPSLKDHYGFFDRPNAFNIVHDLFPVFSQSKISSFADILYPSPWYWYGKVTYEESKDPAWKDKQDKMYWRGSTTGGFSRDGGWRRQHRQRFVQKVNALDETKILENTNADGPSEWKVKRVKRQDYKEIFDVHFSHVGQCDPGDCDAQKEYFEIAPPADFQDAWTSKYLVDIDGNAFSGRFYAFLESKSLVYKVALFREWHEEWLKPWVHYIPLSLHGDEYLESVRYFDREYEGKEAAPRMAEQGTQWAKKALRNEDLETWFFRLLLE